MHKSFAAAAFATALTACSGEVRAGDSGPTVSRNYQVGAFREIVVSGPYDVQVRTGSNPTVSAQGSEKLLERTTVEVKGDKLVIRPEKNRSWFGGWSSKGKASFTVTVPELSGATIAGSGDIRVDRIRGDEFEGAVAGSGALTVEAVEVRKLSLSIAGSGEVRAGGGRVQTADYDIAGSGDLDAGAVASTDLKVSIAGSGNVRANATGTANVRIAGSGDVAVAGGARCTVKRAGSGNVRCS